MVKPDKWVGISHVLEHILDDRVAMKELFRALKPGGWAILQVPVNAKVTYEDPSIVEHRERVFGQHDHVRVYGLDYYDRLRESGFVVHRDRFAKEMEVSLVQRFGLNISEEITFCTKN